MNTRFMEGARKPKKKQAKDELDRIKQAEKKKRRLEKALATSAAICRELEKKKQRKKEEQERLDEEEGAAIAEAVALHVLIGEEDSDDSSGKITMNRDHWLSSWDRSGNERVIMGTGKPYLFVPPRRVSSNYSLENTGFAGFHESFRYGKLWNLGEYSSFLSVDHIAAECVSSLKIADEARRDAYYMSNRVLRG